MVQFTRIKLLYQIYNLFNYSKLKYQDKLYKKFGLKKWITLSLSSNDLPAYDKKDCPWLDRLDSEKVLQDNQKFRKLNATVQTALLPWSTKGYAKLKSFFSEDKVEIFNNLLTDLVAAKKLPVKQNRKIMFAVRNSIEMKTMVTPPLLLEILELLLGKPIELFQSVNFLKGSEDPAHSDFFHLSTYPYGYMIAVWIALEDIDIENGPIYYYPGSHKLPYIMNKDIDDGGNRWLLGKETNKKYHEKINTLLHEHKYPKSHFTASKGDIIIWHANLLHGGEKILNQLRTRKSMVLHFYCHEVIRYHEITQRPTLLGQNK